MNYSKYSTSRLNAMGRKLLSKDTMNVNDWQQFRAMKQVVVARYEKDKKELNRKYFNAGRMFISL